MSEYETDTNPEESPVNPAPLSSLIDALRTELKGKITYPAGTVIKFKSRSRTSGRLDVDYDYAGILAADNRWYLTGKTNYYGDRLTTAEFMTVLNNGDVHSIEVATGWATL